MDTDRGPQVMRLPNELEIAYLDSHEAAFIYNEIFAGEKYLAHGLDLPQQATVVDAGANIGLFSLYVKQRAPEARVLAIEPIDDILKVLRMNLQDVPGCRVLPVGLSNADGLAELTYFPKLPGMSGRYADFDSDRLLIQTVLANTSAANAGFAGFLVDRRLRGRPVMCALRRLSSIIDDEGIHEIDLLKIDVEKSEWEALAGIDDRHWPGIRQMVVEVHDLDGRLSDIVRILKDRGYTVCAEQDALFRGTDVYLVYARRGSLQ